MIGRPRADSPQAGGPVPLPGGPVPLPGASVPLGGESSVSEIGVDGLDGRRFDVVVIGGGILGAGVAREMARRGRSCLLVERHDFGWGTTARSTRLIHGGLRYLANYDFGLVREGLRERAWQLAVAPNLVTPLPFVLPFYGTPLWQRLRLRAGLTLYDALSPWGSLPRHRLLGAAEVARLEPSLSRDRLLGAAMYWDGQVELPERLVIEALRAAGEAGAEIRNHVEAHSLGLSSGGIRSIELVAAQDGRRASVESSRIVNASGPWADSTLAGLGLRRPPLLRLNQGIHLVYPVLAKHAIAFEHPDDRRLCFAVPWQGMTMVGTTETDLDDVESARVSASEVRYLERAVEVCFPTLDARPIWATVGVRSLIPEPGRPSKISREHLLVDHASDGAAGLVTVAGGKLTAWRSIAAEVVDQVLGERDRTALDGSGIGTRLVPARPDGRGPASRLWRLYGARAAEVESWVSRDDWWGEPLLPGGEAIRAEVAHAIACEWAASLSDIVLRRLALGFGPDLGRSAGEAVASVAVERLGWSSDRAAAELRAIDAENAERRLPV